MPSDAAQEPHDDDLEEEDWSRHLTEKLRKHFENTGRYLVEQQVWTKQYPGRDKRLAAMAWLGELRRKDRRASVVRFIFSALIAVGAAFGGAYWGAHTTVRGQADLQERQVIQDRAALIETLAADVRALKDEENGRYENLKPLMQRLIEKDQTQEDARPWLLASVSSRFPVYEENAGRLGLLESPLPEEVAGFYGLSASLRSQINIVTSPPMIFAKKKDKEFAVDEYERILKAWNDAADKIVATLRAAIE